MRYEPQPMMIQFRTVTPVFIGNGTEITPLSFVSGRNTVYVLDENRFFEALSATERQRYLEWIDPVIEQMNRLEQQMTRSQSDRKRLRRQLRELDSQLSVEDFIKRRTRTSDPEQFVRQKECVAYEVATATNRLQNGFRAFIKNSQDRPYLPGTTVKGSLRTALLFAMLEDQGNYQVLRRAIQDFGPVVRSANRNDIRRQMPGIAAKMQEHLVRGVKNDAKYDLLRMFRVSDSEPLSVSDLRLEISKSVGTDRYTTTILETVRAGVAKRFRLEVAEGQNGLLTQLGLDHTSQWVSATQLMKACYERAERVLAMYSEYCEGRGERQLTQCVRTLQSLNNPQTPLVQLGGGQGLLSITEGLWVHERDPDLYEILRQGISIQRNWQRTVPGNFPKTRRVIWRGGEAQEILGWIQLIPPDALKAQIPHGDQLRSGGATPPADTPVSNRTKLVSDRETGTVKWFNDSRGYGFILPDEGGEDVFVHSSQVMGSPLRDGEHVSFSKGQGRKGIEAQDVRREE